MCGGICGWVLVSLSERNGYTKKQGEEGKIIKTWGKCSFYLCFFPFFLLFFSWCCLAVKSHLFQVEEGNEWALSECDFFFFLLIFQQIKQVLTARDRRGRVHWWFGKLIAFLVIIIIKWWFIYFCKQSKFCLIHLRSNQFNYSCSVLLWCMRWNAHNFVYILNLKVVLHCMDCHW